MKQIYALALAFTFMLAAGLVVGIGIGYSVFSHPQAMSNDFVHSTQLSGIVIFNGSANGSIASNSPPLHSFATNATTIIKCFDADTHQPMNCTLASNIIKKANASRISYYIWNSTKNGGWSP